jgi:hypothetical protein
LLVLAVALAVWVVAFARLQRITTSPRNVGAHDDSFGHARKDERDERQERTRPATRHATRVSFDPRSTRAVSVSSPSSPLSPRSLEEASSSSDAVTFVLVANMHPNSAPRVANLLASMRAFLDPNTPRQVVAELLVLVPDDELAWWTLAASALGSDTPWGPTRVIPESKALPTPGDALRSLAPVAGERESRGLGYRVQMLLKLAASAFVTTDFYVTLDCDVVLGGPLKPGDLVRSGKGLAQGNMGGPHAERWLAHSTDAVFGVAVGSATAAKTETTPQDETRVRMVSRVDACGVQTLVRGIGVTPAVLSAGAARRLLELLSANSRLEGKLGETTRWDARLFASLDAGLDWTEYGLYAAFACLEGTFEDVHVIDATDRLYDAGLQEDGSKFANLDRMKSAFGVFANDGIEKSVRASRSLFVVVQSIGGSDPRSAARAVAPFLLKNDA